MSRNLAALLLSAAAAFPACRPGGAKSPAVAHVGDGVITADELKGKLEETSPFLRARYTTLERKKEFLDNLIRNELLAQEAQRRGLDKSPQVRERLKLAMIQELIRQQLDARASGNDIPAQELTAFYDAHIDDFVKPERARLFHILLPAKDESERKKARARAAALRKEIEERTKKGEVNAFQAMAIKESKDAATASMGGDLRFLSKDELARAHGPELAAAAFALKDPGEMAGPIDAASGVELLKMQVKTTALNRSFEDARDQIRSRMAQERRSREYDDFIRRLRDTAKVAIDEVELAKVNPAEPPKPAPAVPSQEAALENRR